MTAFVSVPKAMWVNQVTIDKINDVIDFTTGIGCKHLFYGIGANTTAVINGMKTGQPTASFQAMRTFQQAGGKIWLMGGTVGWLSKPAVVPTAAATIIEVIAGNGSLFAGIHLDVEPWDVTLNPSWPTTKVQDCTNLYTLYGTVKKALPSGAKISAAMTGQVATIFPAGSDTSFLASYQTRLHEIAMMFYWNTLTADAKNTAAARAILNARKNWWFGQSFKQGGSGSWWKQNPNGQTNRTAMASLWDETAKPSNAKGIALYTYNDLISQLVT
jgi:hypothetical protein